MPNKAKSINDLRKKKPVTHEATRPNANQRGYNRRWRAASKTWLSRPANRLCRVCKLAGVTMVATVVDHITPHRGDQNLFWDRTNWQPLCQTCHNRKTGSGR
jgi:5-methylcytosine-specific restriction protein A